MNADSDDVGYYQSRQIELVMRRNELEPLIQDMQEDSQLPHHPQALTLWYQLQDGILPYAGGWLEQPAWYVADMEYMNLLYEYECLPLDIKRNAKRIQDLAQRAANGAK